MEKEPDTSLVIQDQKITHSRTPISSQTLRKKRVPAIKIKVEVILHALYLSTKLLLHLQRAKSNVWYWYFTHALGPFEEKMSKITTLPQHMSPVN